MTRDTFQQIMRLFAATWPERAPSADTLAAYWLALSHLDDAVFQRAARQCLQTCTFYPKPAEILSAVRDILDRAGVLPKAPAAAWSEVETMLRTHGTRRVPAWSNPQIGATVREFGGMRTLAMMDGDRLPYLRREWLTRYGELRAAAITADDRIMAQPLPEPAAALSEPDDGREARIVALRRENLEALHATHR